ncbi:unnamed protein product, partial [Mesorhabditis spiculigera]
MAGQLGSLQQAKRKLETEIQALHADLDETISEYRTAQDNATRAMADAAKLADALRQEQDHTQNVDRAKKALEQTLREFQSRLDEAEAAALKGGKKVIQQLEKRSRDLESELDGEQRRFQLANKDLSKAERKVKELEFQMNEDKKNFDRLNELVDKLQNKLKQQKKQIDEAEEQANVHLGKYRQIQHQLEDAEERADMAENSVSKLRAKSRVGSMAPGGGGLQGSASVAVMRSASRGKF